MGQQYHEHMSRTYGTELTDHERTVIMTKLDPTKYDDCEIGKKLAYNKEWRQVFSTVFEDAS